MTGSPEVSAVRSRLCAVCTCLITTLLNQQAGAADSTEAQTSVRVVTSFAENPDNEDLYGADSESSNRLLVRHSLLLRPDAMWRMEFNAYGLIAGSSDKDSAAQALSAGTDEKNRSPQLERHWHDSHRLDGWLTMDRANVRGSFGRVDVTAGRFAVNMAVTTIFAPNDFFAPFRPQNFYREHKPGVDGARIDTAIGDTGQVSVMGISGYKTGTVIGRVGAADEENRFAWEESSAVVRGVETVAGYEVAVLAGRIGQYNMAGLTLQGEAGPFGLKLESHQKSHRRRKLSAAEIAGGADYRVSEQLLLQVEGFSHGTGYPTVDDYERIETDQDPPVHFVGRNYGSFSGLYEIDPLVTLKSALIGNLTDNSALLNANLTYSVATGGEVSCGLLLPRGKGPRGEVLRSEYGAYPAILTLETGLYF